MRSAVVVMVLFLAAAIGCSATQTPKQQDEPQAVKVPMQVMDGDVITIPVDIDGIKTTFIVDTGIGIHVISRSLCEHIRCEPAGSHTGKRMSGQTLTVPLVRVGALSIGGVQQTRPLVGVLDGDGFFPDPTITGFVSLDFFRQQPFTFSFAEQQLVLESDSTLKAREQHGHSVTIRVDEDGPSVGVFLPLTLPNAQRAEVEVDTGSSALILHTRYLEPLGVDVNSADVKRKDGKDESGHSYSRWFTTLPGTVYPAGVSSGVSQQRTMFQDIIYDGLAGTSFLKKYTVTFDLRRQRMLFQPCRNG